MNEPENIENSDQDKPEAAQMDAEIAATAEAVEIDPADAAADADEAAEAAAAEDVAEPNELETALSEVADLKDKLLRAMAETENMRRRAERDKPRARSAHQRGRHGRSALRLGSHRVG